MMMDEETENLLRKAKELVNDEFRLVYCIDDGKENDIPCSQPPNKLLQGNHLRPRVQSINDARMKIRQEWEALKNSTISPINESITEKANEIRKKDSQKDILFGVVAYVEVKDREKHVAGLKYILKNLGATVKDNFAMEVTHVIFKNGSLETYKRAKLLNVHLVSVLWVNACRNSKTKVCERLFPVVDSNDYSNSPRVFRRFMEYQSKFYEYDQSTGGIIRKSSKNKQQSITNRLQNLNLCGENNSSIQSIWNRPNRKDSSNESYTLRLSDDSDKDTSKDKDNSIASSEVQQQDGQIIINSEGDYVPNQCTDKSDNTDENTITKRKLFAKRPMLESFSSLSQGDQLSGNPSQIPVLVNPYGYSVIKKKKAPPNAVSKPKHETPPKKQEERKIHSKHKDTPHIETYHGILNFHGVYKQTHPMFRPPSKYNNTDHGKCPSLVSTSLHASENKQLKQIVSRLGGFHFKAKVDKTTTHVVCGESRRTINLMKAIARGCWVLHIDWVGKSAAAGRWLSEEQFEMVDFSKLIQRSRIQKQTLGDDYSLDIFDECGAMYVSDKSSPPKKDLMDLIVLCGGKVTSDIVLAKIVVGEKIDSCANCVAEKWILDSIQLGRYKSLNKYRLGTCLPNVVQ